MEFGPIFRSLFRNTSRTWLVIVEVALTLAVVTNCLAMIADQRGRILRPTGLAEDEIVYVNSAPFAPEFQDDDFVRASFKADLRALNEMPGVRGAISISAVPLSGGGSSTGRKRFGAEEDTSSTPYFLVSDGALDTLGLNLVAGRDFEPSDYPDPEADDDESASGSAREQEESDEVEIEQTNIIVTQALADRHFPDGDALGGIISNGSEDMQDVIVGIVDRMHNAWPLSPTAEIVMLRPGESFNNRQSRYLVRVEAGRHEEVISEIETALVALEPGRLVRTESMSEVKGDYYSGLTVMNQMLGGVSILLVVVTGLGIIGLTSFSVTQRVKQIGTRRALGATRFDVLRFFLVENWMITGFGLTLGLVLTYGLNFALANMAETPRLGFPEVLMGMFGLWLIGLIAALAPALRGASVSPVVATRSV